MVESGSFIIRPIRFDDVARLAAFHESLSQQTVRWRYSHEAPLESRTSPHRLERVCRPDSEYEFVFVVVTPGDDSAADRIIGVARMERLLQGRCAEVTMVVADDWQHRGIGHALHERLMTIAREHELTRMVTYVTPDNAQTIAFCESHGFTLSQPPGGDTIIAELTL